MATTACSDVHIVVSQDDNLPTTLAPVRNKRGDLINHSFHVLKDLRYTTRLFQLRLQYFSTKLTLVWQQI